MVEDHFYANLRRGAEPLVHVPLYQRFLKNPVILVKAAQDPRALLPEIRSAVREVNPEVVVFKPTTLDAYVRASTSGERATATLLFGYSSLAFIGTYGVVSRMVVSRCKEIGIRTALGAPRSEVVSGAVACLIPVRRALRVDPVEVLRAE